MRVEVQALHPANGLGGGFIGAAGEGFDHVAAKLGHELFDFAIRIHPRAMTLREAFHGERNAADKSVQKAVVEVVIDPLMKPFIEAKDIGDPYFVTRCYRMCKLININLFRDSFKDKVKGLFELSRQPCD